MALLCNDGSHWLSASRESALIMNMQFYQCKKSHCGDQMVVRWSYLLSFGQSFWNFAQKTAVSLWLGNSRAANRYGISVFCMEFTCKIREYEFGLQNTEIELCQFCHIKYCCQNKAYLFWVANQSIFVEFYALKPSNTSLITKTLNLLSSTCSSNTFSCHTSCSCSTERIH